MISIDSSEHLNIILCCFVIFISRIQIFPEDVVIPVPFRIVLRKVLELELLGIESIFSLDRAVATTVGRMAFVLDPSGVRICLIEHSDEYKEKYM